MCVRAYDRCMQIHGGIGLTNDVRLYDGWHQARTVRIADGTGDPQADGTGCVTPWIPGSVMCRGRRTRGPRYSRRDGALYCCAAAREIGRSSLVPTVFRSSNNRCLIMR